MTNQEHLDKLVGFRKNLGTYKKRVEDAQTNLQDQIQKVADLTGTNSKNFEDILTAIDAKIAQLYIEVVNG